MTFHVKALEWHGPDYEDEYWAASIIGRYTIQAPTGNGRWLGGVGGYFQDIDEAKAAAQADLKRRILSAISLAAEAEPVALEVEWVVNEIAELGVKIGNQFFFCYKGHSLTYTGEDGSDVVLMENSTEPMHWRPIRKREFGECIHPINYDDLTKIGTVSLDDSDEWKPLPAAAEIDAKIYTHPSSPVSAEVTDERVRAAQAVLAYAGFAVPFDNCRAALLSALNGGRENG